MRPERLYGVFIKRMNGATSFLENVGEGKCVYETMASARRAQRSSVLAQFDTEIIELVRVDRRR